jgi:hypothetical protein
MITSIVRAATIALIGLSLAGCGSEGPFGNTPGPKKPQWSLPASPIALLNVF